MLRSISTNMATRLPSYYRGFGHEKTDWFELPLYELPITNYPVRIWMSASLHSGREAFRSFDIEYVSNGGSVGVR